MTGIPYELFGYRVIAKLGSGAASELYAVQDPKTMQVWALKHVKVGPAHKDDRFIKQVEQEHDIGSKLSHPNIRRIGKLSRIKKLFTTMEIGLLLELIDAESMDQRRPKNIFEAASQFEQVAKGLAHMHENNFVHADIKPINAMVSGSGEVKIIDLGQACKIGTEKKRIQGTPGYMAPEQANRQPVTEVTDIYNLGATMYWVLVGEVIPTAVPPHGNGKLGVVNAAMIRPPQPPHERNASIPLALSELILECVKVDPSDRVQSMSSVIDRLQGIVDSLQQSRPVVSGAAERSGK